MSLRAQSPLSADVRQWLFSLSLTLQESSSGTDGMPTTKNALQFPQSLGAPFMPGTGTGGEKARLSPWDPEHRKRECGEAPIPSCTSHMLRHVLQGVLDLSPEEIG